MAFRLAGVAFLGQRFCIVDVAVSRITDADYQHVITCRHQMAIAAAYADRLGTAVIEAIGHGILAEPAEDRHEDRADAEYAKDHRQGLRDARQDGRDPITFPNADAAQEITDGH